MERNESEEWILRGRKNVEEIRKGRINGILYNDMIERIRKGNGEIGVKVVRKRNKKRIEIGIGK